MWFGGGRYTKLKAEVIYVKHIMCFDNVMVERVFAQSSIGTQHIQNT